MQGSLFPVEPYPPAQRDSQTSQAAAEAIEPRAATLRRQYLDWLRSQGDAGATDEEAQQGIPMSANTQRPRRCECVNLGLVRDSGRTRRTSSGRAAVVWVAVV